MQTVRIRAALIAVLAGVLAGAAGVAASEAVAALVPGVTSPVLAVGDRAVDLVPRPLKEWAVESFGTADKPVLLTGLLLTVVVLSAVAGVLARRSFVAGAALLVLLGGVAGVAAVTDRAATAPLLVRLLPVLVLVAVAVGALHLLVHAASGRPVGSRRSGRDTDGVDRRAFLHAALSVGAVVAAGGVLRRVLGGDGAAAASRAGLRLPPPVVPAPPVPAGAELGVRGVTPYLTSSDRFYRVDTALRVPAVPVESWVLRVHGLVDRPLELSFRELLGRRLVERRITLTCVSNPVGGDYLGNALWLGVPTADLLREAGVRPGADAVRSRSVDGFTAGTPLSALRDPGVGALVAVGMNGTPLPLEHGFPARLVTPGLYGFVSATKWLVDLEVTRFADFTAYWTARGYAARAPIKTSSRIDVPRSFARVRAGRTPVAGVAWAQGRGVRAVQVRVDGGPWHDARLAAPDGVDTWRQWVWQWDAQPGSHSLEVRAVDGTGAVQTSATAPVAPDGATGLDSVTVTVV